MRKLLKELHVALLILLFSTIALNFIPTSMEQATTAIISVSPSSIVLGEEGQPLPKSFSLSVNVTDVTDLYSWQIILYYSSRVLNLTTATAPTGHVFEGKDSVEIPQEIVTWRKTINNSTAINFTNVIGSTWVTEVESPDNPATPRNYNIANWIDKDASGGLTVGDVLFINPNLPKYNEFYYVDVIRFEGSIIHLDISVSSLYWGAALLPPEESFTGNGTLCQLNFNAIRPGVRSFNFSLGDTYLLDPDIVEMPVELGSGSITVHGIPVQKDPSSITIDMESTTDVGSSVRISGAISPLRVGATVKIEYRLAGGTFATLTETQTEEASSYSFQWNPAEAGTYEFKASWAGDEEYQGAESETKTVTVTTGEEGSSTPLSEYLIYIVIIVVIIIIVVGVYFLRIKKKS